MLVKNSFLFVLLAALAGSVCAETYWLNMPGSYSEKYHESTPSVSLPLADYKACQNALVQYQQDNEMVDRISCDLEPLKDAINLADQWASN